MTIKAATPYLILGGRAEQAIALYERALGATVKSKQRFGDMDASCPEARRDMVMHAELGVGDAVFMLSDGGPGEAPTAGGPTSVALSLDDTDQTRSAFDALAVGGNVVQPIFDSPWGSLFGVVVDQFGISWMFDCAKTPAAAAN